MSGRSKAVQNLDFYANLADAKAASDLFPPALNTHWKCQLGSFVLIGKSIENHNSTHAFLSLSPSFIVLSQS